MCSAAKRDIGVIGRWESNKDFIGGERDEGSGDLINDGEKRRSHQTRKKDTFVVFRSFCEVNPGGNR